MLVYWQTSMRAVAGTLSLLSRPAKGWGETNCHNSSFYNAKSRMFKGMHRILHDSRVNVYPSAGRTTMKIDIAETTIEPSTV